MIRDPIRLFRRWRRLRAAAEEEAAYLRRLHGAAAVHAAAEKLQRTDLTSWGRLVLKRALRRLQRELPARQLARTSDTSRRSLRPRPKQARIHAFSDHD